MKVNARIVAIALWLTFPTGAAVAAPSIDVGFSPEGTALQLVLRTLDDARESIRLMGYSFTSPKVVKSLVAAKRRGVDVRVVWTKRATAAKPARRR